MLLSQCNHKEGPWGPLTQCTLRGSTCIQTLCRVLTTGGTCTAWSTLACTPSRPCLMRGCPPSPHPPILLLLLAHPLLLPHLPSQLQLVLLLLLLPNHLTATANHSHSHSNSLRLLLLLLLLVWEPCTLPHTRQSPPAPTLVLHARCCCCQCCCCCRKHWQEARSEHGSIWRMRRKGGSHANPQNPHDTDEGFPA